MIPAGDLHAAWRSLPLGTLDGTALVLAPHPDDESLGCGGLIADAVERGRAPVVAILTDGAMSHPGSHRWPRERRVALRRRETEQAMAALGLPPDRLVFLGAPDGEAPDAASADGGRLAHAIATLARRHGCDTVLATSRFDPHGDHVAADGIAALACRLGGMRHLAYPVWSWTLPPDLRLDAGAPEGIRIDIARHLPRKRRAIAAHASQAGRVIDDDPSGFAMSEAFIALFDGPTEVLVSP